MHYSIALTRGNNGMFSCPLATNSVASALRGMAVSRTNSLDVCHCSTPPHTLIKYSSSRAHTHTHTHTHTHNVHYDLIVQCVFRPGMQTDRQKLFVVGLNIWECFSLDCLTRRSMYACKGRAGSSLWAGLPDKCALDVRTQAVLCGTS